MAVQRPPPPLTGVSRASQRRPTKNVDWPPSTLYKAAFTPAETIAETRSLPTTPDGLPPTDDNPVKSYPTLIAPIIVPRLYTVQRNKRKERTKPRNCRQTTTTDRSLSCGARLRSSQGIGARGHMAVLRICRRPLWLHREGVTSLRSAILMPLVEFAMPGLPLLPEVPG